MLKKWHVILKSQSGSSMLSVLMIVPAVLGLSLLTSLNQTNSRSSLKMARVKVAMNSRKQNILSVLSNDQAWRTTILQNTTVLTTKMNCLDPTDSTPPSCNPTGAPFEFPLFDAGVVQIQGLNEGFTLKGEPCTYTSGDITCPIRYKLEWTPVCPTTAPCNNPGILITGRLEHYHGLENSIAFNPKKYNFSFVR